MRGAGTVLTNENRNFVYIGESFGVKIEPAHAGS